MTANLQSTELATAVVKDRPDDADNRQIGLIHAPSKARGDHGSLVAKVNPSASLGIVQKNNS